MIPFDHDILILLCLLLALFITLQSISLKKQNRKKDDQIQQISRQLLVLQDQLEQSREEIPSPNDFSTDLDTAEITTKLQKSRLDFTSHNPNSKAPERYQFIPNLIQKGLSSEEIAAILSISPEEAEQLVTLAQLTDVNNE